MLRGLSPKSKMLPTSLRSDDRNSVDVGVGEMGVRRVTVYHLHPPIKTRTPFAEKFTFRKSEH